MFPDDNFNKSACCISDFRVATSLHVFWKIMQKLFNLKNQWDPKIEMVVDNSLDYLQGWRWIMDVSHEIL